MSSSSSSSSFLSSISNFAESLGERWLLSFFCCYDYSSLISYYYSSMLITAILIVYILIEIGFYFAFHWYYIPRANNNQQQHDQQIPPPPYRDYGRDRTKLLIKILKRIENTTALNNNTNTNKNEIIDDQDKKKKKNDKIIVQKKIIQFLSEWFHGYPPPGCSTTTTTTAAAVATTKPSSSSSSGSSTSTTTATDLIPPRLYKCKYSSSASSSSSSASSSSPENSDTDNTEEEEQEQQEIIENNNVNEDQREETSSSESSTLKLLPVLCKKDIDEFFGWAFFGKSIAELQNWEKQELQRLFDVLEQETGISFPNNIDYSSCCNCSSSSSSSSSSSTTNIIMKPRCMSLEPVNALYRPLLVYLLVIMLKIFGGIILYCFGFQRYKSQSGLIGWYRPPSSSPSTTSTTATTSNNNDDDVDNNNNTYLLPILFFHGIAPGGLVLYLPMVLFGIAYERDRPIYLFENNAISCSIDLEPLTEEQTVNGVIEILQKTTTTTTTTTTQTSSSSNNDEKSSSSRGGVSNISQKLSLVGHSFGSCPITWLLANKTLDIQQVTLIDPVAIMLSEPDVMVNFLYAEELNKIRMVASSELFTEYYLRRHFAWYNSELWLDDMLPSESQLLVCLSEHDEIVNSMKVQKEMQRLNYTESLLLWKNVGHAACVTSPKMWNQIKQRMLQQELHLLQQQQQQQ